MLTPGSDTRWETEDGGVSRIESAPRHESRGGVTDGRGHWSPRLARDIEVFTTAGSTHADEVRRFGAIVTAYGDGVVERVKALGPVARR